MLALLTLVGVSCADFMLYSSDRSPEIARVGEVVLRESALENLYSEEMDTLAKEKAKATFVNSWVLQELKRQEALEKIENRAQSIAEIDAMVEEYRTGLLIHSLEQDFLRHNLDTAVSAQQIREYYEQNPNSFRLVSPLVKAIVVRMPEGLRNNERLEEMFTKGGDDKIEEFLNICQKNNYRVNDMRAKWVEFSSVLRYIPVAASNSYDEFLKKNKVYDVSDNEYKYILRVESYLASGELSPLEREEETIKKILKNMRRSDAVEQLNDSLMNEARREEKFKIQ